MEIAHKIISDDFFLISNSIEKNTDLHWSIIMKFKSRFCSDSKLIYVKKKNWKNEHVYMQVPLPIT